MRNTGDDPMELPPQDSKAAHLATGPLMTPIDDTDKLNDFSATVLKADVSQRRHLALYILIFRLFYISWFLPQLESLRNHINPDHELQEMSMPCGDEIRLLLFARCDREKEDWYRRFVAASKGFVHERDLQVPLVKFVDEADLQAAAAQQAVNLTLGGNKNVVRVDTLFPIFFLSRYLLFQSVQTRSKMEEDKSAATEDVGTNTNTPDQLYDDGGGTQSGTPDVMDTGYEGLIMNADVARNSADYIKFMAVYQVKKAAHIVASSAFFHSPLPLWFVLFDSLMISSL